MPMAYIAAYGQSAAKRQPGQEPRRMLRQISRVTMPLLKGTVRYPSKGELGPEIPRPRHPTPMTLTAAPWSMARADC